MTDMQQGQDAAKKLVDEIKGIRIAMLTTVDEAGVLSSRPMATQEIEFDGDIWFFTQADSPKVEDTEQYHQVNVAYASPSDNRFVSVSGRATLVRDHKKLEELWNPLYKTWFPKGLEDPELALLKISVSQAEYWDGPSNKMVQLIGMARAYVTGNDAALGDNVKLDLSN